MVLDPQVKGFVELPPEDQAAAFASVVDSPELFFVVFLRVRVWDLGLR